jgi:predicted O-linked N-acetylglucosamine transferase (SPINDLY family)
MRRLMRPYRPGRDDGQPCQEPGCRDPRFRDLLHIKVADLFEARGQIDLAWQYGQRVSHDDAVFVSRALQAQMKSPRADNRRLLALQRQWAATQAPPGAARPRESLPGWDGERPIRVAYLCPFFHLPTGLAQILPFVAAHDRRRVRVFGYSACACPEELAGMFDTFRVTGALTDQQFHDQCRADGIDVVVELAGLSQGHRLSALASRCARVQVSTFNHTGTTGIEAVDWVLADALSAPASFDPDYVERIYRLDGCFLCTSYAGLGHPQPAPPPSARAGFVTFGCFGSGNKINRELIGLWAEVLRAVPGARLLLRNAQFNLAANRRLRIDQFRHHGIAAERLDFRPAADRDVILAEYGEVDVSLDTWPYCGGNTIAESLWQGVPVVTLLGETLASRYGASILHASGLGELVASSAAEYVALAAGLAADLHRRKRYRHDLRRMMVEHGFSDPRRYAAALEDAYADMLRQAG